MKKVKRNTSINLIKNLYNQNKVIFSIKDVQDITSLNYFSAGRLISELKKRGIISSFKRGKHIIVPQEIGNIKKYIGNWFVAAKEIANSSEYYISFYSAMDFWGMVTHPINKVFISTPKRQIAPNDLKNFLNFIFINKRFLFGITEEWINKQNKVRFSDIEKTILDGLFHPEYCGGITEVATGVYLVKDKIDFKKLIQYVKKYNKNIIAKRLGYLLEILEIGNKDVYQNLKKYIKNRYDLFDPSLSNKNLSKNNWRLIDNVSPKQIKKIIKA